MLQGKFKRAVAFAIGAWVAQACLTSSTVAQQEPKRGGTLVFGINSGDPPTYDCHQSALFPDHPPAVAALLEPAAHRHATLSQASSATSPRAGPSPTTSRPTRSGCARTSNSTMARRSRRRHQGDLRPHPQSAAGRSSRCARAWSPTSTRSRRPTRSGRLPPEASRTARCSTRSPIRSTASTAPPS